MKKTLKTFLVCAMSLTLVLGCISVAHADGFVKGDMNGDGLLTSDDAVYLLFNAMNNFDNDSERNYFVAGGVTRDMNQDGIINTDDATYLLFAAMNGEDRYPLPDPIEEPEEEGDPSGYDLPEQPLGN